MIRKLKKLITLIFEGWIASLFSSILGLVLIREAIKGDYLFSNKIVLFFLGLFLQIPLFYLRIYKFIFKEK